MRTVKRLIIAAGLVAVAACWAPTEPIDHPYTPSISGGDVSAAQDATVRKPRIKLDP